MSWFEAIVLGLLQGITEFLPISSTAHLRFVPAMAGWDDPGAAFTAVTQLGTLAAVVIYFARDLVAIARGWLAALPQGRDSIHDPEARLGWFLLIGTLPLLFFGAIFAEDVETGARSLSLLAWMMILLGLALLAAEKLATHERPIASLKLRDAVAIGLAQALALVPGVSRAGATLTMGLFVGLRREAAARYSFLLSIPAVGASGAYELYALITDTTAITVEAGPLILATAVAFVSGYAAIAWLLRFLQTHTTIVFVVYRVMIGLLVLSLLQLDAIS